MGIKIIRRNKNTVKEYFKENTIIDNSKIINVPYPFVVSKPISSLGYYTKLGHLVLDIENLTELKGNVVVQSTIPDSLTYTPVELELSIYVSNDVYGYFLPVQNKIITKDTSIYSDNSFVLNIPSSIISINKKIILIIRGKNIGPGSGKTNVIDLIYFEKKS